jgi:hypothetical protein
MKKKIKIMLALGLFLLAPAAGFALFDINVYGGLPFSAEFDSRSQKLLDTDNYAYGTALHLNSDFLELFKLGLGGFYELSAITYEDDADFTLDRSTAGIEGYVQFEIPLLPISPYVKANSAAWNKVKMKGGGFSDTDYFKKHGLGAGFVFTLLPIPALLRLQIFAEYMYHFGKEDGLRVTQHNAFLGLRADFF